MRFRFPTLLVLFALTCRAQSTAPAEPPAAEKSAPSETPTAPAPETPPAADERKAVPMDQKVFADYIGRYQREDMLVLIFRDHGHFFIKVDDRPRAEIFPLSDHEFFLHESPDVISFERDRRGEVTHFIRHSTAPQLFRRVQ